MKKILGLSLVFLLMTINYSVAVTIIPEQYSAINEGGDSLVNKFSVNSSPIYTNIVLNIDALGDYGSVESNEFIKFYLDGTLLSSWRYDTVGVDATLEGKDSYDWRLQGSVIIEDDIFNMAASDGWLTVKWVNGSGTGYRIETTPYHYVSYSIEADIYPSPEPSTMLLFGFGLLAVARISRK